MRTQINVHDVRYQTNYDWWHRDFTEASSFSLSHSNMQSTKVFKKNYFKNITKTWFIGTHNLAIIERLEFRKLHIRLIKSAGMATIVILSSEIISKEHGMLDIGQSNIRVLPYQVITGISRQHVIWREHTVLMSSKDGRKCPKYVSWSVLYTPSPVVWI